jgi:hypothetical protein
MTRTRTTIAGWMGVIALAATGLWALRYPSWLAANFVFTLALVFHFVAIVAVINLKGPSRGFWSGFAICGWGYLILSVGPGLESTASARLATTTLLDFSYEYCFSSPYPQVYPRETAVIPVGMPKSKLWNWPEPIINSKIHNSAFYIMSPDAFLLIGHSLLSLPIAWAGGRLGRSLARRAQQSEASASHETLEQSPTRSNDLP